MVFSATNFRCILLPGHRWGSVTKRKPAGLVRGTGFALKRTAESMAMSLRKGPRAGVWNTWIQRARINKARGGNE
jgi:hypothetical protein